MAIRGEKAPPFSVREGRKAVEGEGEAESIQRIGGLGSFNPSL